jgi:hypothetical protein
MHLLSKQHPSCLERSFWLTPITETNELLQNICVRCAYDDADVYTMYFEVVLAVGLHKTFTCTDRAMNTYTGVGFVVAEDIDVVVSAVGIGACAACMSWK